MVAMVATDSIPLTAEGKLLPGVLLNCFQHTEAGFISWLTGEVDQALVDQPRQPVEGVIAWLGNRLGRREREAASEDAQSLEKNLLGRAEEIDAPSNGVAKGLLPLRRIPGTPREER